MMSIYILGWVFCIFLSGFCIILMIKNKKLQKKTVDLAQYHQDYVFKQMIDLRTICHNINTPINNIVTVLEVFRLELYGTLPSDYVVYANATSHTIDDLKNNIKDIQTYCDSYADIHKISISDMQSNKMLDSPYVIQKRIYN
jgi:hypothetical protein